MGDKNKEPFQISQIIKPLTDITGYAIGIVTYFTAITGRLEIKYSTTVAILTLVATTVALWTWRWPQVSRRKSGGKNKTMTASSNNRLNPYLARMMDPLRSSNKNIYTLPLIRRRIETAILCALTVVTIGRLGTEFPNIMQEINPPLYVLEPPCDLDEHQNGLTAVIADFYETASHQILFEERLRDEMLKEVQGEVQVCRLKQVVEDRTQALAAVEGTGAAVLIWGRSDTDAVDVHLEVSGWDILSEDIWSFRGEANDFQSKESSHLTFLTQYSFSVLRYITGQFPEARQDLEFALSIAEGQPWIAEGDNKTDIADAYFLLGLIYEDDGTLSENGRLESARKSYESALENDPDSDAALLNKGYICKELGDQDCAMEAFTTLIDGRSDLAASAYINRAYLQPRDLAEQDFAAAIKLNPKQGYVVRGEKRLEWGDLNGAVTDLKTAVELTPDDADVYHSLGKAQLLKGDFAGAIGTYKDALPHVPDEATRQYFIDDLNALTPPLNADEHFQETINQITHILEEVEFP